MLINISKEEVKTTYNQKEIIVRVNEQLDVRDFGVQANQIEAVEKHVCKKNPGIFKQEKTKDIYETNKEHLKKIDALGKEISDLSNELSTAKTYNEKMQDKMNKALNENEGLKNINMSLKKENKELLAKLKAAQ